MSVRNPDLKRWPDPKRLLVPLAVRAAFRPAVPDGTLLHVAMPSLAPVPRKPLRAPAAAIP